MFQVGRNGEDQRVLVVLLQLLDQLDSMGGDLLFVVYQELPEVLQDDLLLLLLLGQTGHETAEFL